MKAVRLAIVLLLSLLGLARGQPKSSSDVNFTMAETPRPILENVPDVSNIKDPPPPTTTANPKSRGRQMSLWGDPWSAGFNSPAQGFASFGGEQAPPLFEGGWPNPGAPGPLIGQVLQPTLWGRKQASDAVAAGRAAVEAAIAKAASQPNATMAETPRPILEDVPDVSNVTDPPPPTTKAPTKTSGRQAGLWGNPWPAGFGGPLLGFPNFAGEQAPPLLSPAWPLPPIRGPPPGLGRPLIGVLLGGILG